MHNFPAGTRGQRYWYHHNGQGAIAGMTKQRGQSTHNYRYDAYGGNIPANGNFTNPHNDYTLTEKSWDDHTGLYYFGARHYDPLAAVWLTQDTYRGRTSEPITLHRFAYVRGNPINWIDSYGFDGNGLSQEAPNYSSPTASPSPTPTPTPSPGPGPVPMCSTEKDSSGPSYQLPSLQYIGIKGNVATYYFPGWVYDYVVEVKVDINTKDAVIFYKDGIIKIGNVEYDLRNYVIGASSGNIGVTSTGSTTYQVNVGSNSSIEIEVTEIYNPKSVLLAHVSGQVLEASVEVLEGINEGLEKSMPLIMMGLAAGGLVALVLL
jgi:RHS repeat-associated protein